jgi:hypothetical protein
MLAQALTLADPTPFTLSSLRTGAFFVQPERKDVCRPARGVGGVGDVPCKWSFFFFRIRTRLVFLLSLVLTSFTHSVGPGGGASLLLHRFYWGFFILERGSDEVSSNTLRIVRRAFNGAVSGSTERPRLFPVFGFFWRARAIFGDVYFLRTVWGAGGVLSSVPTERAGMTYISSYIHARAAQRR